MNNHPRRPRIKLADVPQHVVQLGINCEPYFFAEEDDYCYLHWLKKSAADWHYAIHASAKPDGIAKMMPSTGRRYVQYINRSYHRTGSLWEGRFKSSLVQAEEYLLTCITLHRTQHGARKHGDRPCAVSVVKLSA